MITTLAYHQLMSWPLYALLFVLLFAAGCDSEGDLVVDPRSSDRDQVAMIAVEGSGGDEIVHFDESSGTVSQNAYQAANGASLALPIDNITEAYDQLFLHHRAAGKFTVLDVSNRTRRGEITGFPASADSGICGLAFSNSTWAWVVCYNSDTLYLVDAKNYVIARRIKLSGRPTSVGTVGQKIFVGMQMPDGIGGAAVLSSNTGLYEVERVIPFPSPVIFAAANSDDAEMLLLSSGAGAEGPKVHLINLNDFSIAFEIPVSASALTSYIGRASTFAIVSKDFYFYIATPSGLIRTDTKGSESIVWLPGDYRVVGIDRWTELVYGTPAGSATINRVTGKGEDLEPLVMPSPVKAITFVSGYKTR